MVAFRLLDKVIAAELIGPTVKAQVLPYATKHKLRLDNVLSHYIEVCANSNKRLLAEIAFSATPAIPGPGPSLFQQSVWQSLGN